MQAKHDMENMSNKTYELIYDHMDEALSDLESKFESYDNEMQTVDFEPCSGFIPFTNGGLVASVFASNSIMIGSGTLPVFMRETIEAQEKEFYDDWMKENPSYDFDNDADSYSEAVDYYLGYSSFDIRALFFSSDNQRNETGEDEVYFDIGYNLDEYGHDIMRKTLKGTTIKLCDITSDSLTDVMIDLYRELEI